MSEATQLDRAREVLTELGIDEENRQTPRPPDAHHTSILLPCVGRDGRSFLLKFFTPPEEGRYYPPEVSIDDYARREIGFYSFLDSFDSDRRELPAPRTIMMDSGDPPRWILLEYIEPSVGPKSETLESAKVFDLLGRLRDLPRERLTGRRNFPLNRWDVTSLRDRVVRLMYDPLIFIVGEETWADLRRFFNEAVRWCETRPQVPVHGDFTEENILVDPDGMPFLVDFERIGTGSAEHDFTWFWIHGERSKEWKRDLYLRFTEDRFGSDRVRSEWSIRATGVYLACRRLRFGYLSLGESDENRGANLALLRAAVAGGAEFFPQ